VISIVERLRPSRSISATCVCLKKSLPVISSVFLVEGAAGNKDACFQMPFPENKSVRADLMPCGIGVPSSSTLKTSDPSQRFAQAIHRFGRELIEQDMRFLSSRNRVRRVAAAFSGCRSSCV